MIRECFPTSVLLGSIERPVEPQVDRDDDGDDESDQDYDQPQFSLAALRA